MERPGESYELTELTGLMVVFRLFPLARYYDEELELLGDDECGFDRDVEIESIVVHAAASLGATALIADRHDLEFGAVPFLVDDLGELLFHARAGFLIGQDREPGVEEGRLDQRGLEESL